MDVCVCVFSGLNYVCVCVSGSLTSAAWLEHPVCSPDCVHPVCLRAPGCGQPVARSCAAWRVHSLCRVSPAPRVRVSARQVGARSSAFGSQDSLLGGEWLGVGALCRLPRARARRAGTRRVRARARAPRLQPGARSRLRCHSQLPGAAAASPRPGALSAGPAPLAPSQEDELEEDAWAREYRGGGGPGGPGAREEDDPGLSPSPRAAPRSGPGSPPRTPRPGQPLPQPTPEGGGREREGGRQ